MGAPLLIIIARAWLGELPECRAQIVGMAASFVMAFAATVLLSERVRYHQTNGILAATALQRSQNLKYFTVCLGGGFILVGVLLRSLGAGDPEAWAAGFALGFISGWTRWRLSTRFAALARRGSQLWQQGVPEAVWTAPLLAASGFLLGVAVSLFPAAPVAVFVALLAIGASLVLGRVRAGQVRFMAMVGHSPVSIMRAHTILLASFLAPLTLGLSSSRDPALVSIAALFTLGALMVVALLVLAYQVFSRKIAEWVVTLAVALTASTALALPPAAPVVGLASLLWLYRRAAGRTWLIP